MTAKPKASVAKVMFFYLRLLVFLAIEVLVLLRLDGWLFWAMLAIVVWNVAFGVMATVGMVIKAVQKMNEED